MEHLNGTKGEKLNRSQGGRNERWKSGWNLEGLCIPLVKASAV